MPARRTGLWRESCLKPSKSGSGSAVWSILQRMGTDISTYIIFVGLAKILSPKDFGVVSLAGIWIAFVTTFSDMGLSSALIQRQDLRPDHLSSAFFMNLGMGALLCLIGFGVSIPFSLYFKEPQLMPVICWLSVGFFINSISLTHLTLATREFRFKALALRDVSSAVLGGSIGLTLALKGFGVWSLVAQSLVGSLFNTIMIWWISPWRPRFSEASSEGLRDLWGYSSKLFGFNIFKYFVQNTDRLLVGSLMGPVALGYYSFAVKVMVNPVSGFMGAIGKYLFPRFSRLQNRLEDVKKVYLDYTKFISCIVFPVIPMAMFFSSALLPGLLGEKWRPAVPIIMILSVVTAAQSLMSPLGQLMKALNRPSWLLWWSMALFALTAASLWAGSYYGLVGVAAGFAVAHAIGLVLGYFVVIRLVPVDLWDFAKALGPVCASSAVSGAFLWAARGVPLLASGAGAVAALAAASLLFAFCVFILDRKFAQGILQRVRPAAWRS
jgi:O-antigen/teichoic acid export membrane protein